MESFSETIQRVNMLRKGRATAAVLAQTIEQQSAADPLSSNGDTLPTPVRGEVQLRDVVFAYALGEPRVMDGLSLSVAPGEALALCGPSGCGKSTVISLIERFYSPSAGAVLLDGVDVKTLNVRWLRSQLGLVGQEPVLFSGSVQQNVSYGKPGGASRAEVEAAAKAANAHGFITSQLANGYETDVGAGGGSLSGGQKQRVAIARALVRRPAVLLLDEATSALDAESEVQVQCTLDKLMSTRDRTVLMIAHRLATVRSAHSIAVLADGVVAERGTYDELVKAGRQFSRLSEAHESFLHRRPSAAVGLLGRFEA